ncbi:MAG: hypothetical protein ACREJU_16260 [Nitrospiraceae bacterium]
MTESWGNRIQVILPGHGHQDPHGAHESGFRETRVEHLAGPDSMVVGIK